MPESQLSDWWTVRSIADHLGISVATVHAHHRRGTLAKPQRLGRSLVWTTEQVVEFESMRRSPGRPSLTLASANQADDIARVGVKALGAFYTPPALALAMARWIDRKNPASILEPSAGDGEFIRAYSAISDRAVRWYAHEIDELSAASLRGISNLQDGEVLLGDFLASDHARVDAAIGNPPFVRLRNLPKGQMRTALARSSAALGSPMESAGSAWLPFVTHATALLNAGGNLALVLPWEVTYVRYARVLWEFLGRNYGEIRVVRLAERAFPKLSQDVVILLAAERGGSTGELQFDTYANVDDFAIGRLASSSKIAIKEAAGTGRPFQFALVRDSIREEVRHLLQTECVRADSLARFNIGYVTGSKSFFHPSEDDCRDFSLSESSLLPTVADAKTLRGGGLYTSSIVTPDTLFYPSDPSDDEKNYLAYGESKGVHLGYKCRTRKPWFKVPDVRKPDLVLSVFSEAPVLMVNDSRLSASNSLLIGTSTDPLGFAGQWYSKFTTLGIELAVHSLGGGVLVLVPREASSVLVWNKEASEASLNQVDQSLKLGDPSRAYSVRDKDIEATVGAHAVIALQEATEDLRAWRRRS